MKRLAIMTIAALAAVALAPRALDAGVGIKAGFSLAKFSEESADPPAFPWENLPFFAGGLSFESGFAYVSVQTEVFYVRMGGKFAAADLEYRFDYVQVPVLLKINIVPAGPVRPFLGGGGYGAYLIKARGVLGTETGDLTEDYERLDYGLVGGVGLAFRLAGIGLSIEGRYNHGLRNLIKDAAPGASMKNRCLMALAGISF